MARRLLALLLAALALAASACSEEPSEKVAERATEAFAAGGPGASPGSGGEPAGPSEISTDLRRKPEIPKPEGEPPTELVTNDVVEGDGAEATRGSVLSLDYVGLIYDTGEEFDTSWGREPLQVPLGANQTVPGFEQGLEGMKVGGRREIVIPPDLGFGARGSPPVIPPNATIVFVVDLRDVQPGAGSSVPSP